MNNPKPDTGDASAISAPLLRRWAQTLADAGRTDPVAVAEALGLQLRPGWLGYAQALDPPDGVGLLVLTIDDGLVRAVTVELDDDARITEADLEASFGNGTGAPVLHPGSGSPRIFEPIVGARGRARPSMELRGGRLAVATLAVESR